MIRENILGIRERISLICSKINQDPNRIAIIAVGKGRTQEQIKEAITAGITDIGENRVQEALIKYNELITYNLELRTTRWHMVGHLQTNKVKEAVRIFDLIQSIDSLRLACEIDKQAARISKNQDILIQVNPVRKDISGDTNFSNGVNTSGENTKFGFKPIEVIEAIKEIAKCKNINIRGLMTIAPIVDDAEKTRPYFRMLRELRDRINELQVVSYQLQVLSMGMTDDFQVAIEEGSNMIRLGRAIFEG